MTNLFSNRIRFLITFCSLLFTQHLIAVDADSEWVERLPNGNIRLNTGVLDLDWSKVQLRAILNEDPQSRFLIDFNTLNIAGRERPPFPLLTSCDEGTESKCIEIDYGPSARGWYTIELTIPGQPNLRLTENLLIGYNLEPKLTHYHSEDSEGPYNDFQLSINDPDGFEDINKVFLILSDSTEQAEGIVVGVDLREHKFFEGLYSSKNFDIEFSEFDLLDDELSSYESFSSIVRFNPRINFDAEPGKTYYVFVGFEERFTGVSTHFEDEFTVSDKIRPRIETVFLYLDPALKYIETIVNVNLPDTKENLSSLRIKLIGDTGGSCQLLYDVRAGRGKIISNDSYSSSVDFESEVEFSEKVLNSNSLEVVVKAPFPDGDDKVRAQVQAVTINGKKSEASWSGPLVRENIRSPGYQPIIETAQQYLSRAKILYPNRRMFKNSDIVIMRAYAPLSRPEFMSAKDFFERFSHDLYTPYPYKHYPIDYDVWNYSRSILEQATWVPNVSFTIDTNTLNLTAFPIEPVYKLEDIAALDFNLEPNVIPPWMRGFPRFRELLSATRDAYLKRLYTGLDYGLSLGAHSIQLDGFPNGGMIVTMGGDFSEESMTGFALWLEKNLSKEERIKLELPEDLTGFNYLSWLKNVKGIKSKNEYMANIESLPTTRVFRDFHWSIAVETYHKIRAFLDLRKPKRHIPITSNGAPDWFAPAAFAYNSSVADALVAEVHFYPRSELKSVNSIYAYKMADALKVQLASVPKGEENDFFADNDDFARGILPAYIAESYAMGHRLMVPWAYWRKSTHERYYTDPAQFKGLFNFIDERRRIFDKFAPITTTAIVVRYTTMQPKTERIITELLEHDIPFTMFLADDNFYPRHLTEEMLDSVQRIILVDPINWYNETDQLMLMKYQHKIDTSDFLSPASTKNKDIYTVPWGRLNANEHVIHLLNRRFNSKTKSIEPQRNVNLVINSEYINPNNMKAFFFSPSNEIVELDIKSHDKNFTVHIPKLNTWGLLYLGEEFPENEEDAIPENE